MRVRAVEIYYIAEAKLDDETYKLVNGPIFTFGDALIEQDYQFEHGKGSSYFIVKQFINVGPV